MKKYTKKLVVASLGLFMLFPSFAFAQDVGVSATVNAEANVNVRTDLMVRAIERADREIERRIAALERLVERVQSMRKVNAEFKQNLSINVQNQISGLVTLKAKIAADTDAATLKADVQTITQSYRVFALLMPQAAIAAAADRIVVVVDMMVGVGNKLQSRIDIAAQAGADVEELSSVLADLGVQLSVAQTKAQDAINGSAALSPDNSDKNIMASNTAALKAAREQIQEARAALVKARQDISSLIQGLRSIQVNTTSNTEVQVQ